MFVVFATCCTTPQMHPSSNTYKYNYSASFLGPQGLLLLPLMPLTYDIASDVVDLWCRCNLPAKFWCLVRCTNIALVLDSSNWPLNWDDRIKYCPIYSRQDFLFLHSFKTFCSWKVNHPKMSSMMSELISSSLPLQLDDRMWIFHWAASLDSSEKSFFFLLTRRRRRLNWKIFPSDQVVTGLDIITWGGGQV